MSDWVEKYHEEQRKKQAEQDQKGGPGSGHYGHAGRPGKRGGSLPANVAVSIRTGKTARERQAAAAARGKKPSASDAEKLAEYLHSVMGEDALVLETEPGTVKDHLANLAQVPAEILGKAAAEGARVYIGNKPMTELDKKQYLKGEVPRGWEDTPWTWDNVAGCSSGKIVVAGRGLGHSEGTLIAHEFAHTIGYLTNLDHHDQTKLFHAKLYEKFEEYLQQGGPGGVAGRQEMLAETLSILWKHGYDEAAELTSPEYVDFLQSELKEWANA